MRRRQLYRAMTLAEIEKSLPAKPVETKRIAAKGYCSKCGKQIGKGVHFHEKACKGAEWQQEHMETS